MNVRQWIAVVIVAVAAGLLGGMITGIFAGGVNFYIYTPNNNSEMTPLPEPPQPPKAPAPPASAETDEAG